MKFLFFLFFLTLFQLFNSSYILKVNNSSLLTCSRTFNSLEITNKEIKITDIDITMSITERVLFYRYLLKSNIFFEYGAGGSTYLACEINNINKIYTVDTEPRYLDYLLSNKCLNNSYINGRFYPTHATIGSVKKFIHPNNLHYKERWHIYPEMILTSALKNKNIPDLVLIDGKFRVASVLASLIALPKGTEIIIIHDFFPRKQYYPILDFLEPIDCADSVLVGRRRDDFDIEAAKRLLYGYVGELD